MALLFRHPPQPSGQLRGWHSDAPVGYSQEHLPSFPPFQKDEDRGPQRRREGPAYLYRITCGRLWLQTAGPLHFRHRCSLSEIRNPERKLFPAPLGGERRLPSELLGRSRLGVVLAVTALIFPGVVFRGAAQSLGTVRALGPGARRSPGWVWQRSSGWLSAELCAKGNQGCLPASHLLI